MAREPRDPLTVADLVGWLADVDPELPVYLDMRGWLGYVDVQQEMVVLQRLLPDMGGVSW